MLTMDNDANIGIKWREGIDNQKADFVIYYKFRSLEVCYNELWYCYLVTSNCIKFIDLINLQFCPLYIARF